MASQDGAKNNQINRARATRGRQSGGEQLMKKRSAMGAAMALILAACGGGGGDSTPVTTAFNLDAALSSALSSGVSFSGLKASASGVNFGLAFSYAPTSDGAFQGQTYKRAVQTATLTSNGAPAGVASATVSYSLNPARLLLANSSSGAFTVYEPKSNLPTAATVGQSGTLNVATTYASNTLAVVLNTSTTVWSLEPDSTATAWACLTTTTSGVGAFTSKECYRVNGAGAISGAKITLVVSGQSITFQ